MELEEEVLVEQVELLLEEVDLEEVALVEQAAQP